MSADIIQFIHPSAFPHVAEVARKDSRTLLEPIRLEPHAPPPGRKLMVDAVKAGLLEPAVFLDLDGRETRGYRPTEKASKRYDWGGLFNRTDWFSDMCGND